MGRCTNVFSCLVAKDPWHQGVDMLHHWIFELVSSLSLEFTIGHGAVIE